MRSSKLNTAPTFDTPVEASSTVVATPEAPPAALKKPRIVNPLDWLIISIAERMGGQGTRRAKELERFFKFAIVGVSGAILDIGILFILQASILHPVADDGQTKLFTFGIQNVALASGISFLCAVMSNFIWTRYWVYPEGRATSLRRQLAQFMLFSIIGGVVRTIWIATSFLWIGNLMLEPMLPIIRILRPGYMNPSPQAAGKLGTLIAQLIGMVFVMVWNFAINRFVTYRDVK
jgi:putative flippase GtrA